MTHDEQLKQQIAIAQGNAQREAQANRIANLSGLGLALTQTLPPAEALHVAAVQLEVIASINTPDGKPLPAELDRLKRAAAAGLKAIKGTLDSVIARPSLVVVPGS